MNIYWLIDSSTDEAYGRAHRTLRSAVQYAKIDAATCGRAIHVRKIDGRTLLPSLVRRVFPEGIVKKA